MVSGLSFRSLCSVVNKSHVKCQKNLILIIYCQCVYTHFLLYTGWECGLPLKECCRQLAQKIAVKRSVILFFTDKPSVIELCKLLFCLMLLPSCSQGKVWKSWGKCSCWGCDLTKQHCSQCKQMLCKYIESLKPYFSAFCSSMSVDYAACFCFFNLMYLFWFAGIALRRRHGLKQI